MREFKPTFPQFRDNGQGYLKEFLLKEGSIVVLFFCPTILNDDSQWEMVDLIERLKAKYGQKVLFNWLNSSEEKDARKIFSVNNCPTIILICRGKEFSRFVCSSSEPGICFELDELLNLTPCPGSIPGRIFIPSHSMGA